ncbi:MAG: hypothetical protein IKE90_03485 [Bacilli bacterium]|nr:hypothetical protein [Bacilli bacterium]
MESKKNNSTNKKINSKSKNKKTKEEIKQLKENKKTKEEIKQVKENKKIKHKLYISYEMKIATNIVLTFLLILIGSYYLIKSINVLSVLNVNYREKSNLDYKVYLKNNEFYDSEYLGKGMSYVASLIDKITADFNYTFDIDKESSIDFDYDITAELVISDTTKNNILLKKDYTLLQSTKENMKNAKQHTINKTINIDYDYYNKIANKFKVSYGIDTKSDLNIYLNIHEKNTENNSFKLENKSVMALTIPLSQKSINITLDYKDINKTSQVIKNSEIIINNYVYLALGTALILIGILETIHLIKLLLLTKNKKTNYDKYINKILNEYDRLIVETTTAPNMQDKNIIKINRFNELLDVRDNLKLPIKYYVISKHQKCQFYIDHEEELYILTIKEVDIEKNDNIKSL